MSKELDKAWITIYHYNDELIHDMGSEYIENPLKEELDIVNNALLRLKEIDNAKPSEALKSLKIIGNCWLFGETDVKKAYSEQYDTIEQYILKAQEQEKENARNKKLIDVIKNKRLDMWHIMDLLDQTYDMYLAFCKSEGYADDYILTREEFDLIKEMFKDE